MGAGLKPEEIATHPKKAPAHVAGAVLAFNEQMERIVEVALVLYRCGAFATYFRLEETWFIAVLFLIIRPFAVHIGLWGRNSAHLSAD